MGHGMREDPRESDEDHQETEVEEEIIRRGPHKRTTIFS